LRENERQNHQVTEQEGLPPRLRHLFSQLAADEAAASRLLARRRG
jgi:hypothetical protein